MRYEGRGGRGRTGEAKGTACTNTESQEYVRHMSGTEMGLRLHVKMRTTSC